MVLAALALAHRGVRLLLVDLSMIAPNQEQRLGVFGSGAAVLTIDELPPWSMLHLEPTSGVRVVSAPRSMTARTPESLAMLVPRLLELDDGSAEVVVLDLDGLSNNALHRTVLGLADDVVFVLDHSSVTLEAVKRTAAEIQNQDDAARNSPHKSDMSECVRSAVQTKRELDEHGSAL